MKIYAIYRMYYGEDFIEASISSILSHVDTVFVFAPKKAFADVHIGRVDKSLNIVRGMAKKHEQIVIIENEKHYQSPINQFTDLYNTYIYKVYDPPDAVMCIEPDMVWRGLQLNIFIKEFKEGKTNIINSSQFEFWHNKNWRIPIRYRNACILHRLKSGAKMVRTRHSGNPKNHLMVLSDAIVFNLGFCVTPKNMFIKTELGIRYSKKINDSIPNTTWFRDKWLSWDPKNNNRYLEISKGYEHYILYAEPTQHNIFIHESLENHKWNPDIFTQVQELSFGDILNK